MQAKQNKIRNYIVLINVLVLLAATLYLLWAALPLIKMDGVKVMNVIIMAFAGYFMILGVINLIISIISIVTFLFKQKYVVLKTVCFTCLVIAIISFLVWILLSFLPHIITV